MRDMRFIPDARWQLLKSYQKFGKIKIQENLLNLSLVCQGPTSLMDELFEAESKNLTQETLTPTPAPRPTTSSVTSSSSAAALTLNFEKGKLMKLNLTLPKAHVTFLRTI